MGQPKAWVDFEGEPLLVRTMRRVAPIADVVLVVGAPKQKLPSLPDCVAGAPVVLACDAALHKGPVSGLLTALDALDDATRALAAGDQAGWDGIALVPTDAPFISAEVVARLFELRRSGDWEAAVPRVAGYTQPLCAVYSPTVVERVRALVLADRLRPRYLLDQCSVRWVTDADLLSDPAVSCADPTLRTFENINTPKELACALGKPRS